MSSIIHRCSGLRGISTGKVKLNNAPQVKNQAVANGVPAAEKNLITLINIHPKINDNKMKKLLIIFIVLIVSTSSLYSQNKTIQGRIISNQFETLYGIRIIINDTVQVGITDRYGFFQINIPVSMRKLLFLDVGFETKIIDLADTCNEVEVVMMLSSSYDFKTPRKVDRLRKKKFMKLPEFHKQAFEKGLFKTDKACYTQKVIPYYKRKQK